MTIARIWRGWTTGENTAAFQNMLMDRILPEIRQSELPGLLSMSVMRRPDGDEIEFQTILFFETLDSIKAFAGEDAEQAHLDPEGVKLLSRCDARARHFELIDSIDLEVSESRKVMG